jgi:hypothetical protein
MVDTRQHLTTLQTPASSTSKNVRIVRPRAATKKPKLNASFPSLFAVQGWKTYHISSGGNTHFVVSKPSPDKPDETVTIGWGQGCVSGISEMSCCSREECKADRPDVQSNAGWLDKGGGCCTRFDTRFFDWPCLPHVQSSVSASPSSEQSARSPRRLLRPGLSLTSRRTRSPSSETLRNQSG